MKRSLAVLGGIFGVIALCVAMALPMNTFSRGLLGVVFSVVIVCTFLASIRITKVGLGHLPANRWLAFITHDGWAVTLVVLVPWFMGSFARHEISPLPWGEFSGGAAAGLLDLIVGQVWMPLLVIIVDLWFLWIPAHSYVRNRPGLDRRSVWLARGLNLAIGFLLLTPQNPIYKLIMMLLPRTLPPNDY